MSTATATSPVAALRSVESAAVAQIEAVTAVVHQTATSTLADAVARLRAEVASCQARVRTALASAVAEVIDLAESLGDMVAGDVFGLMELPTPEPISESAVPSLPEPITARMQPELPLATAAAEDTVDLPEPPVATATDAASHSAIEAPTSNMPHKGESPAIDVPAHVPQVETTVEEPTGEPSRNGRAKTARRRSK